MDVIRTYLELRDPAAIRPPSTPARVDGAIEIVRTDPPDGATSRWFYEHVGRDYGWTDQLSRTEAQWQRWAEGVETWVLTVGGARAGYHELRLAGDVEIAYFGLLRDWHGLGLGGHLLAHALRRAFAVGPRAWVHTCTLDGPHALANYQARGLRPFRTEVVANR